MPKRRNENAPYWQQLRFAERQIIEYAIGHGGTVRGTAAILGISSNYLSERMRELGLPLPEVRPGPKPGTKRPARPELRVVSDSEPNTASDTDESDDEELEETVSEDDADEDLDEDFDDEDDDDEEDEDSDGDGDDEDEDDAASGN